ncbi:hypothetical protein EVAR_18760_1 [Eumeta japonica]|uniref:Uncharacterized protein n=1 Tax=Eumeta variegata TaxID=151549 RepID=A0A4C1UMA9_EUMVA|nr:hypothetical protein EVAR_18760_1 [Eumeta japonica]
MAHSGRQPLAPIIVEAIIGGYGSWVQVRTFCEELMSWKKAAEESMAIFPSKKKVGKFASVYETEEARRMFPLAFSSAPFMIASRRGSYRKLTNRCRTADELNMNEVLQKMTSKDTMGLKSRRVLHNLISCSQASSNPEDFLM